MDKKQEYEDLEKKIRTLEKLLQTKEEKEVKLLKRIDELEKTEKYFNVLMQNTEDYVLVCDIEGVSLAFNESYKKKGEELHSRLGPPDRIMKFQKGFDKWRIEWYGERSYLFRNEVLQDETVVKRKT